MRVTDILEGFSVKGKGSWNSGGYGAYVDRIDKRRDDMDYDTRGEDSPDDDVRVYIKVPYAFKDLAKKHGAHWDSLKKSWYIYGSRAAAEFKSFVLPAAVRSAKGKASDLGNGRIYLTVPYSEKDNAKSYGARWDRDKKKWYYEGDVLPARLKSYDV